MLKYSKVIDETGKVIVGSGTNTEFYKTQGFELLEVEKSEVDNMWYLADKCPHKSDEQLLEEAKENKIKENDIARDEALNGGVEYKNILFDSDTDQKVNLLATVSTMDEEATIVWFGMDNTPLECNKSDLINIGGLITQLHSFCWNKNAEIKALISEAETVEEVNSIVINYKENINDNSI